MEINHAVAYHRSLEFYIYYKKTVLVRDKTDLSIIMVSLHGMTALTKFLAANRIQLLLM